MKKVYSICLAVCLLFSGCATKRVIDESKRNEMYVMVYDYENKGLQNVRICIDDTEIGRTDIYGRYVLALTEGESYAIRIEKKEYETIEREFLFDPMYVLYFQIGNAAQFLRLAENAMDEGEYEGALGFLDRSIELDSMRIDAMYLKAIAYYRMGMNAEALKVLERLVPLVKNTKIIDDLKKQIEGMNDISGL